MPKGLMQEGALRRHAGRLIPLCLLLLLPQATSADTLESASFLSFPSDYGQAGNRARSAGFDDAGAVQEGGRGKGSSASFEERAGFNAGLPFPALATGLTLTDRTTDALRLSWTAPFADQERSTGTLTGYLIRFSSVGSLATDAAFAAAADYPNAAAPLGPGQTETRWVTGLDPDTTYFLAVEGVNAHGVRGQRSASVSSATARNYIAAAISTPSYPGNAGYVSTSAFTFNWVGPSTTVAAGLAAGSSFYLQVSNNDPGFASAVISVSTPVVFSTGLPTADGAYTSTFTLANGTTYYWRVAARLGSTDNFSPWSSTFSFFTDFTLPASDSFASKSSTGGLMGETQWNDFSSGTTVQIKVQDTLSGLLKSTSTIPGNLSFPPGGFGVMYSTNAGQGWVDGSWAAAYDPPETGVHSFSAYNGKLYAGTNLNGVVYAFDGASWSLSYDSPEEVIYSLAVYNGKLYAGSKPNGLIYVFDGTSWSLSYDSPETYIYSLAVYNGKLYAASAPNGRIYAFDGTSWSLSHDSPETSIIVLSAFNGKLYAGSKPNGLIYVFDGVSWSLSYDSPESGVPAMAAHNGKLYAGSEPNGLIYVFDGASWSASYDSPATSVQTLTSYNGKLYAGAFPGGIIYAFDGSAWSAAYDSPEDYVMSLFAYNGRLYAGSNPNAIVYVSTPAAATLTGADGTTLVQTLSVTGLDLVQSTNTQTCAGVSPCGATNQVVFTVTDLAGNVRIAGPYAVLVDTNASPSPLGPANGAFVSTTTPALVWSTAAAGSHRVQLALDPGFTSVIADSTTANAFYVSTNTLTHGAAYWWRARPAAGISQAAWSPARSFTVDAAAPVFGVPQAATASASPSWVNLPSDVYLTSSVVSLRLSVQDPLSGLLVSTGLPTGLIGQWHFDESSGTVALDASPQARSGFLAGGAAWAAGKSGSAVNFDGTGMAAMGNLGAFPAQGAIEFWVNPSAVDGNRNALTTQYNADNAAIRFEEDAAGGFIVSPGNDGGFQGTVGTYLSAGLQAGTWYHIGYVWDTAAGRQAGYLNGVQVFNTANTRWPSAIPDFRVGTGVDTTAARQWKGKVDEVRVYGVARSSADVLADYQSDQLAAHARGRAYQVFYSTTAGAAWNLVSTMSVSLGGANGDTAARTLQADGLPLESSSNLVAVVAQDFAGNVSTAVYTILVDTGARPVPLGPADGGFVSTTTPAVLWSTATAGSHRVQLALDPAFVQVVADSTTANAFYVSTNTLVHGTAYWWRARSAAGLGWSQTRSFTVDAAPPAISVPQAANTSAGPSWVNLPSGTSLSSNAISVRLQVQDPLSGLLVATGVPTGLIGQWHFDEASGTTALDASTQARSGFLAGGAVWAAGRRGSAFSSDGTGMAAMGDLGGFPVQGAIEFWFNSSAVDNSRNALATKHNGADSGLRFEETASGAFTVSPGNDAGVPGTVGTFLSAGLQTNTWYHAAYTWDTTANTQAGYLNGLQVFSAANSNWPTSIPDFRVGTGFDTTAARQWQGRVDEVRLFNAARSPADVLADYQSDRLAAHGRTKAYQVFYSTTAGAAWNLVSTMSVSLGGANGDTAARTLQADDIPLVTSAGPGAPTNQVAVVAQDFAGNVSSAVYTVLVDTATFAPFPVGPADAAFLSTTTPALVWSTATAGNHVAQLALDAGFAQVVADSTTANAFYVSTNTLAQGTVYWWRVRPAGGATLSAWSQARSFIVDAAPPVFSVPQVATASAGPSWVNLPPSGLSQSSSVVSLRLSVQDPLSGLLVSTGIPTGLIGQWHFDESSGNAALDASTQARSGGLSGGATWSAGRRASAVDFDGTGMVTMGNLGAFPARGAIEFWLNSSAVDNNRNPLATMYNGGNSGLRFEENASGRLIVSPGDDAGTQGTVGTYLQSGLQAGTWYHIAYVWDTAAGRQAGYLNGVPVFNTANSLWPTAIPDFRVGTGGDTSAGRQWKGKVDEVRVYNVARSSADVLADYQSDRLAAHGRAKAYQVLYSSTAGAAWNLVSTMSVSLGGANGDIAARTLQADGIPLDASSNLVAVVAQDFAGNVSSAVYTVFVDTMGPPIAPFVSQVFAASVTVTWTPGDPLPDAYLVEASTASDFSGARFASSTFNLSLTTLAPQGLDPNTTYYLRAGALRNGATSYALTTPLSTSTLANLVAGPQFAGVFATSVTVNWVGLPLSPPDASSKTAEGYLLQASTAADFTGTLFSSRTPNAALSTLTVSGLNESTTYYFRVGSLNWNSVPNYVAAGTTRTTTGLAPSNPIVAQVFLSSISVAWGSVASDDGYTLEASTTPDFSGAVLSSAAPHGTMTGLVVFGLDPNTTWYLRAGSVWSGATSYALTTPISTSTLANLAAGPQFAGVFITSVTMNWAGLPLSPPDASSKTAEGYLLQASTAADFTGTLFSSVTPNASLSTLTVSGLNEFTTYYFRVGSLNWNSVPNYIAAGTTRTTTVQAPENPIVAQVFLSSISVTWGAVVSAGGYVLEASTAADFTGTVLSSVTPNVTMTGLVVLNLDPNATYYLRAGSIVYGATNYALTTPISTSTLADPVSGPQFAGVFATSVTVNWAGLPLSPPDASSKTAEGYLLQASTAANFGGVLYSSRTPNPALSTLTVVGLQVNDTYYFRVGALNWNAVPHFIAAGSTRTVLSCLVVPSAQDGPWTNPATWAGGLLPIGCNPVQIGHAVTVDTTAAIAAALTLNGRLSFSRAADSSLSTVQGNLMVAAGGVLDMGTEASPIPAAFTAQLNLAKGEVGGHFGLVVQDGGNFTVRGATRTPYAMASGDASVGAVTLNVPASQSDGWAAGDRIAVGKTSLSGADETEERVITSIGGGDPRALNWIGGLAYQHYSSGPLIVANLTRNVLVRSSGTDTNSNSAYIQNLAANATSFVLAYGEFAFLGANLGSRYGITFESAAKGSISSSTLRNGFVGAYLAQASGVALRANVVHGQAARGIHLEQAAGNVLEANVVSSGAGDGIRLENASRWNALRSNKTYSNAGHGISLVSSQDNVLSSHASYGNLGRGLSFTSSSDSNTVLTADLHSNSGHGLYLQNSAGNLIAGTESRLNAAAGAWLSFTQGNWLAGSGFYANIGQGLALEGGSGDSFVDGRLGYDAAGASRPDGTAEVFLNLATKQDAELKGAQVNPSPGVPAAGFNKEGNFLLSYDQDGASGALRVRGDAVVSGTALTLDYAARLYAAQATPPRLKFGSGHSASLSQVYDAAAITQLVTIERRGGQWRVDGSSSGAGLASFAGSVSNLGVPASVPQFRLDFSQGASPQEGDAVDFLLVAASPSADRQKKLLFQDGDSSHRGGRAKLATSSALTLRGAAGQPTLVDRLDGSSTYYALVASGPFTAERSSFTNMDPGGLQLSGAGPIVLSTSGFDLMGIAEGANAYITARDLASAATFYGLSFGVARSTLGAPSAYNVRVQGDPSGLRWLLKKWEGALAGEQADDDASDRVRWAPFQPAAAVPAFGEVMASSVVVNWSANGNDSDTVYGVEASTAADFTGQVASGTTFLSTAAFLGLSPNTTYYFRANAVLLSTSSYGFLGSTSTLADPVSGAGFAGVAGTSVSVTWTALSAEGYLLQASTASDFTGAIFSSRTPNAALSTLTVSGLNEFTTYYFRVGSLNWNSVPNFIAAGSTRTATGQAPGSPVIAQVFRSSISVAWGSVSSDDGYTLEASTAADFTGTVLSSVSANGTITGLVVQGLDPNTTWYLRAGSLWSGGTSYAPTAPASTSTLADAVSGQVLFTTVFQSSATLNWPGLPQSPPDASSKTAEGYLLQASTAADFTGTLFSSVTPNAALSALTVSGLDPNTTHYFRVGSLNWNGVPNFAVGPATSTLAGPVSGAQFAGVFYTTISVNWAALPAAPQSASAEGYLLQASTAADFSGTVYSSGTSDVGLSTLAVSGLDEFTTYYFRVGALNWNSVPHFVAAGSTRTRSGLPPGNPLVVSVFLSSAAVSWDSVAPDDGYLLEASTVADFSAAIRSSMTPNGDMTGLVVQNLDPNTTWYLRAGSLWSGGTSYALTTPASTSTLADAVSGSQFAAVFRTSATLNWTGLPQTPPDASSKTAEGYLLQASTAADFTGMLFSSSTPNAALSTLTVSGLDEFTSYYFRVGSLNWNSVPNYIVAGTTRTTAGPPPSNPLIAQVFRSSISVTWGSVSSDDGYTLEASTTPDFTGTAPSSVSANGTMTGLVIQGLDPNTTWYLRAGSLWNGATSYALTTPVSTSTLANAVFGPQFAGVFAASVAVNWAGLPLSPPDASSKTAEGYLLQASTAADFTGTLFSSRTPNAALSTLTVSGLNEFTAYYFRIGSLNWNSVPNYIAAGTTRTTPGPPPNNPLIAQVFRSSISVAWGSVGSDDGYVLEASTAADFTGTVLSSVSADGTITGLVVQGLDPNTTYFLRAGSLWSGGADYALTTPASTSTLADAVSGQVLFTAVFQSSAALNWPGMPLSPPDASSKTAEGYLVQASTAADFTGLLFSSRTPNAGLSALTVSGLDPNTTHYFRVGSLNWNGVPNFAVGPATSTLAGPVSGAQFAAVFRASATLNWPALPPAPQALSAEGYLLQASSAADFTGLLFSSATANAALSTLTIAGLDPGTTYHFRVGALNWNSVPNFAAAGSSRTAGGPPPASPTLLAVLASSVSVGYGSVGAAGYLVEASTAADFTGAVLSSAGPGGVLAPQGLSANTTYFLRAGALWGSATSYAAVSPPSTSTLADLASGPQAAAVFQSSATVNWVPLPSAPQAATAEGYLLQASTAPNFTGTVFSSATPNAALSTLTVSGLRAFTTYYFRLGSLNWDSVPNYIAAGTTRTTVGPPPGAPVVAKVFVSSIAASWNAVAADDGYRLEASTAADFSGTIFSSATPSGGAAGLTVSGLLADTTYFLRAGSLWNGATSYALTAPASTATLAVPVSGFQFAALFQSSAALNWVPLPAAPQAATAQGYLLQASTAPDFTGVVFASATPGVALSTLTLAGLDPNTTHYFRVGALNWNGVAGFAAGLSSATLAGPVSGMQFAGVFFTSISVNWTVLPAAPQSASGEGYRLEASTAADFSGTVFSTAAADRAVDSLTLAGLADDATYFLRLGALNWNGVPNFSAAASTLTVKSPLKVRNFRGRSGYKTAVLDWDDLSAVEKGPFFVAYVLYKAGAEAGPYAQLTTTTAQSFVDAAVLVGSTYYYRLTARLSPSSETSPSTAAVFVVSSRPQPPASVSIAVLGSTVTLSWMPVQAHEDGLPFAAPAAPLPEELLRYRVYRATAASKAPWTQLATPSTATLTLTDAAGSPEYYYHVKGENVTGLSEMSIVRAFGERAAVVVSPDEQAVLVISAEHMRPLEGVNNDPSTAYRLTIASRPQDMDGKVLRSIELRALRGGITPQAGFQLPAQAALEIRYGQSGPLVTPSGLAPSAALPTPGNLSAFWFNGAKWLQLYGKTDAALRRVVVQTKYAGVYQLRVGERVGAFTFDKAGLTNRLITPNGDRLNDWAVFIFDNPRASEITGKIFDLKGAQVSGMVPGPIADSLKWDGKSDGVAVPGGAYIYQIEAEGQTYTGTVVVIR